MSFKPLKDNETALKPRLSLQEPKMFRIYLHNDDFTPMDFVTWLLQRVFHKNSEESHSLMLQIHHNGLALCGVYTHEIAQNKLSHIEQLASKNGHPLKASIQEDS